MKVVLFCGGLGMRLRDYAENVPKPMVPMDSAKDKRWLDELNDSGVCRWEVWKRAK